MKGKKKNKKTMVYLSEDIYYRLLSKSQREQRSMAWIIRDSLAIYLGKSPKVDHLSFVGIARGGKPHDTSERADEILKDIMS